MTREYRIGMTYLERLQHKPGKGCVPGKHLNLTITLADVWDISLGSQQPTSPGFLVQPETKRIKFAGFDRTEQQVRQHRW